MTDVLSSIFGKKKLKGPPPPIPSTKAAAASGPESDGFVVIGNTEFAQQSQISYLGDVRNNNVYPEMPRPSQSNDYETLFSFLRTSESPTGNNGPPLRPVRPAPPVPAPRNVNSYGLTPASSSDAQTPSYYLSNVPFQISKSYGGQDMHALKSQVSEALSRVRAPNLSEFEYSFAIEKQVVREANANRNTRIG